MYSALTYYTMHQYRRKGLLIHAGALWIKKKAAAVPIDPNTVRITFANSTSINRRNVPCGTQDYPDRVAISEVCALAR